MSGRGSRSMSSCCHLVSTIWRLCFGPGPCWGNRQGHDLGRRHDACAVPAAHLILNVDGVIWHDRFDRAGPVIDQVLVAHVLKQAEYESALRGLRDASVTEVNAEQIRVLGDREALEDVLFVPAGGASRYFASPGPRPAGPLPRRLSVPPIEHGWRGIPVRRPISQSFSPAATRSRTSATCSLVRIKTAVGAAGGIRTHTSLRTAPFEGAQSASFCTAADPQSLGPNQ